MVFILIIGFYIRWTDIAKIPYGIENDELPAVVSSYFVTHGINPTEKGAWSLFESSYRIFPVALKFHQLSFLFFSDDILSPRKMSVFVSVLALFVFYLFARKLVSPSIALSVLFLYMLSPYKYITTRIPHGPAFSDIFIYLALYLILLYPVKKALHNCILLIFTGLAIVFGMLTYNLAYLMPFIAFLIILIRSIVKKLDLRYVILNLLVFSLATGLFFPIFLKSFGEQKNKNYALVYSAYDFKKKTISISQIQTNLKTVYGQLFKSLKYETGDMFVRFSGPLANKTISVLFLIGLSISFFYLKKYYPLLIYFLINGVISQILLGLFLPRMWFLNYFTIYLFAGIAMDYVFKLLWRKYYLTKLLWLAMLIVLLSYVSFTDMRYYKETTANNSFSIGQREIYELTKKYKEQLASNVLFIMPELGIHPVSYVYSALAFTVLARDPQNVKFVKNSDRQKLGLFEISEFTANAPDFIAKNKIYITENSLNARIEDALKKYSYNPYIIKKGENFSEITF